MEGERSWEPLLETEAREFGPALSADGQWIAYVSDDTGRLEVYVQRFPGLGERQQISTDGGMDPMWSPDGRALFYLGTRGSGPPNEMVVVAIDPGPPLSVGNPEALFGHAPYSSPWQKGLFVNRGSCVRIDLSPVSPTTNPAHLGPPGPRIASNARRARPGG